MQIPNYISFKEIYLSYADSAQAGSFSPRDSQSSPEHENGVHNGLTYIF